MNDYLALTLGVISAGIGGELFVRGAVGLAHWARISQGIIGATVAAFATSSPELSVAINAATAGEPQISFGDALGSNVLNVALILALALVISGIQSSRESVKRDFPVALLIPLVTGVLLLDSELSRIDGLLMLGMFFVWLLAAIIEAKRQRSATDAVLGEHRPWLIIFSCMVGLAFLVVSGNLIVTGARGIVIAFGIDEFIVGATIVALGTSVPELATTLIAKLRGHDEVGLGTILGSNIFNGIFITAVAAIIYPIKVAWHEVTVTLIFGFLTVALTYPLRNGFIERRRGVLLLVLYAAYLTTLFQD
jgi:cation:H+ antiporter